MASRRRRRRRPEGLGAATIGGVLLMLVAAMGAGALAWLYFSTPAKPVLDAQTLCPTNGAKGITVVLVDTSDDLPAATGREVQGIFDDLITSLPPLYRLEIRVLDIDASRSRVLFSKCNPGDGSGLSDWTDNPRLARLRWIESFKKPANDAIKNSLASAKANSSPILGALQDIAIDRFSTEQSRTIDKKLVVISDMIEHTRDYSQYPRAGDLGYQRFRQSPAYLKYRTDLHGAAVTIDYVTRPSAMPDSARHAAFWDAWVKDNGGTLNAIHRLQGT